MNNFLTAIVLLLLSTCSFAQAPVQTKTPINSIQYGYDSNNELVVSVILTSESPGVDFKAQLVGSVNYTSFTATPQEKALRVNFTQDAENPIRYYANLRLRNPSLAGGERKWDRIDDLLISYSHNSGWAELPRVTLFHKIANVTPSVQKFRLPDQAQIIGNNKFTLDVRTEPDGIPSILSSITIATSNDARETIQLNNSSINGNFKIDLATRELTLDEGVYDITIAGKTADESLLQPTTTKIYFKRAIPVTIRSLNGNETIKIKDEDEYESIIETDDGIAREMQIIFLQKEFKEKVKISVEKRNGNAFKFRLSNLSAIESKFSQLYFAFDGKVSSALCTIEKLEPKVSRMSFDVSNSKFSKLHFTLPTWVNSSKVQVQFGDQIIFPSQALKESNKDGNKVFEVDFYNKMNTLFRANEQIKNDSIFVTEIQILHNSKPIYNFEIKFYNQDMLTKKVDQLIAATKIRDKSDRKVAVEKTLTDITGVITKLGGAVEDDQIKSAIKTLTDDNKDVQKVSKTIADVGKWVGTLAPKVIPFVLAAL